MKFPDGGRYRVNLNFETKDHVDLAPALQQMGFWNSRQDYGGHAFLVKHCTGQLAAPAKGALISVYAGSAYHRTWLITENVCALILVNARSLRGTGQLPIFVEDFIAVDDGQVVSDNRPLKFRWPISTVEPHCWMPHLPFWICCHTTCFVVKPSHGPWCAWLEFRPAINLRKSSWCKIVANRKSLPSPEPIDPASRKNSCRCWTYPIVKCCSGTVIWVSLPAKTYDLEVWLSPRQNNLSRKFSSCSNFLVKFFRPETHAGTLA